MKGVYVLVIQILKDLSLTIKSLGHLRFERGTWLYVGSAMGDGSTNLENRLLRHFRSKKTIYWHIDYLLSRKVTLQSAIWAKSSHSLECQLAKGFENDTMCVPGPKGFGASDCRNRCYSHIFRCLNDERVVENVQNIFVSLGLEPKLTLNGLLDRSVP
jgi:Uri superfamily endonuclease